MRVEEEGKRDCGDWRMGRGLQMGDFIALCVFESDIVFSANQVAVVVPGRGRKVAMGFVGLGRSRHAPDAYPIFFLFWGGGAYARRRPDLSLGGGEGNAVQTGGSSKSSSSQFSVEYEL